MKKVLIAWLVLMLGACSTVEQKQVDNKKEYKECGYVHHDRDEMKTEKIQCKEGWPANFPG